MALSGGTFDAQNKTLPGAYINFVSRPRAMGVFGSRGIVCFLASLSWGVENSIFAVDAEDFQRNCLKIFGYDYTAPQMLCIREVFRGAKTVKIYRPGGGAKAAANAGELSITALYGGSRGNDIKIVIDPDIDEDGVFIVRTLIGSEFKVVDTQKVTSVNQLKDNAFVTFSGDGTLTPNAGVNLEGGADHETTGGDHADFLDKAEAETFTTLLYDGMETVTKSLYSAFTKRLRDDEGYKITTVLYQYPAADYEGVISVFNPVTGTKTDADADISEGALVYWTAGRSAGAAFNRSLTNKTYDGELAIQTTYKPSEFEATVHTGQFAFFSERRVPYRSMQSEADSKGDIKTLKDINTFTSFEPYKNRDFSFNQIIRVLDQVANDIARIFNDYYKGEVQNNDPGRNLFRSELIVYFDECERLQAITDFVVGDVEVLPGSEKEDVVVNVSIKPVSAMEKLYMTVHVV